MLLKFEDTNKNLLFYVDNQEECLLEDYLGNIRKITEDLFYQDKVMENFMLDFERFFKSIEMSIDDLLEPSKMEFKREIEES